MSRDGHGGRQPSRRQVLLGASAGLLLSACGGGGSPGSDLRPGALVRSAYGKDGSQFGYLGLPRRSRPLATVVLVHGGAWESGYDYKQVAPMGEALVELGFAVWAIEYRRLGDGGGWPTSFQDVALAIDHLATLSRRHPGGDDDLLTRRVALVGHSAGGQLAVWAASRSARTPGGAPSFATTGVVSLAGVLDLEAAAGYPQMGQPVRSFLGGGPAQVPDAYLLGDPTRLVPASAPVWAVHAVYDADVPISQAEAYVAADRRAGGTARLVKVPGDHHTLIDPTKPSWSTVRQCITEAAGLSA